MSRMHSRARAQKGMTLIELMVALVLGLLLIGGFVNIFISSRQAFRTNEALARMQENGRVGSEMLLREIRAAGGNACGTKLVADTVNPNPTASNNWWTEWANGPIQGFDGAQTFAGVAFGAGAGQRVAGTDLIMLLSAVAMEDLYIVDHNATSANFKVNINNHGLNDGDILMVCDNVTAAMFQATNTNQSNGTIVHNTGTGTPGNCSKGLGYPTDCGSTNGNEKTFADGIISKVNGSVWYIGNNGRGSRSLYRSAGIPNPVASEVVEGVQDMQIRYLTVNKSTGALATSWVDATGVSSWAETATNIVTAIELTLTVRSNEAVGVNGQPISRTFVHVIRLRNREAIPS